MKRGDIVTVVIQGEFRKPRPAVVIESDRLPPTDTVLVCLMTSTLQDDAPYRRHRVEPSAANGLRIISEIMVDKVLAVRRGKCGQCIGALEKPALQELTRKVGLVIGLAD
jgi:mRNA interferase MazF